MTNCLCTQTKSSPTWPLSATVLNAERDDIPIAASRTFFFSSFCSFVKGVAKPSSTSLSSFSLCSFSTRWAARRSSKLHHHKTESRVLKSVRKTLPRERKRAQHWCRLTPSRPVWPQLVFCWREIPVQEELRRATHCRQVPCGYQNPHLHHSLEHLHHYKKFFSVWTERSTTDSYTSALR